MVTLLALGIVKLIEFEWVLNPCCLACYREDLRSLDCGFSRNGRSVNSRVRNRFHLPIQLFRARGMQVAGSRVDGLLVRMV
jgi:hypothetical protein